MAWLRLGPRVRFVTLRCKVHSSCGQLWVPMGRGTSGTEQVKMSNYNGDRLRVSAETMCVFRKSCGGACCDVWKAGVQKLARWWRKRERSWSLGWKDLRVCDFCQTLFVKEPISRGQSRSFPFPTFLIAKTRMRESQNYCLPVGLFFPLKLLPKFSTLGVLSWNTMSMT